MLIAAACCAVVLIVLTGVFVRTSSGQRLDDAALRGQVVQHALTAHRSDQLLRTISVGSLAFFGISLVGIAAARGRWLLAVGVGAVIVGSNATTQIYKHFVHRPDLIDGVNNLIPFNTLPSGHSTVAASLAAALVLVAPVRLRPWAATLGALYACGMAAMTLAAGWHRPSDAVSAFAVVGIWTFGVSAVLVANRGTGSPRVHEGLPGLVVGMVAAMTVAFAVILVSTTLDTADGFRAVRLGVAYVVALGWIVVTGVAFIVAEVLLLRGVSLDVPSRELASNWT
ncbi:MAG: phosphatase PAP2 family protein [Acidimicrobiia bacterium]|nr:phosphatase PAP2 family protein [Acidimicrobiia bacterium]